MRRIRGKLAVCATGFVFAAVQMQRQPRDGPPGFFAQTDSADLPWAARYRTHRSNADNGLVGAVALSRIF
jgi:hypothetical protein